MNLWNRIYQKIVYRFKRLFKPENRSSKNDYYVTNIPSPQNAIDIFKGEWSSKFPDFMPNIEAGEINLFEDSRLLWLLTEVGSLEGKNVLELGPLEGGHSYMLENNGAESIIAIEANTRAYLKCLITKELLNLNKVDLLCGDFISYLQDPDCPAFEIAIASGVLYHMINPIELISLLASRCSEYIFLWTHYYDEKWAQTNPLGARFLDAEEKNHSGFSCQLFRQYYGSSTSLGAFCGGSRPYSYWMPKSEIINCLKYFGFSEIKVNFDEPDHPNGPAFALIAQHP